MDIGPFIDGFPIKIVSFHSIIAMLGYQRDPEGV